MDLYTACTVGNIDRIKYFISNGINIHDKNDYALRLAGYNGHLDIVKYLVL